MADDVKTRRDPLAIVAGTGYAAEVIGIAQTPAQATPSFTIAAIVGQGDLLAALADRLDIPLLTALETVEPGFFVAVADGRNDERAARASHVAELGLRVATLIHRDATIGPWVDIGAGTLISPGARVTGNVTIGRHCLIHTNAVVSHDDVLGDYVTISPSATLCGGVTVGASSTVFAGATVLPGVTIGSGVTVGAGALVTRDVADGATVVGMPAAVKG